MRVQVVLFVVVLWCCVALSVGVLVSIPALPIHLLLSTLLMENKFKRLATLQSATSLMLSL